MGPAAKFECGDRSAPLRVQARLPEAACASAVRFKRTFDNKRCVRHEPCLQMPGADIPEAIRSPRRRAA
jgi:hypothetical protein